MRLSRIMLVLCALVGCVDTATAQFTVGAKGGINLNSFRGNDEYDVVPGFNGGFILKHPLLPFLSGRVEALYMQQGANLIDYPVLLPDLRRSRSRVAFHSAQVPVLLEFGLPSLKEDNLQPKVLVGGFYSYTVYARETYNNVIAVSGYGKVDYDGYSDVTSLFERQQYGFIGAIAADVKVRSVPISIEFRYQYNLDRVNKPETVELPNLRLTHQKWGDNLNLSTLSINVAATLFYF